MAFPEGEEGQDGGRSGGKAKAPRATSNPEAPQSVAPSTKQPKKATLKEMATEIKNRLEGLKIPPTLGE